MSVWWHPHDKETHWLHSTVTSLNSPVTSYYYPVTGCESFPSCSYLSWIHLLQNIDFFYFKVCRIYFYHTFKKKHAYNKPQSIPFQIVFVYQRRVKMIFVEFWNQICDNVSISPSIQQHLTVPRWCWHFKIPPLIGCNNVITFYQQ